MVLTSAGRHLRERLTNVICIFSQEIFSSETFPLTYQLSQVHQPIRDNDKIFFCKVFSTPLRHLGGRGKKTQDQIFSVGQRFPHQNTHHWWCANHQNCTPELDTGSTLQLCPRQELLRLWPLCAAAIAASCHPHCKLLSHPKPRGLEHCSELLQKTYGLVPLYTGRAYKTTIQRTTVSCWEDMVIQ